MGEAELLIAGLLVAVAGLSALMRELDLEDHASRSDQSGRLADCDERSRGLLDSRA